VFLLKHIVSKSRSFPITTLGNDGLSEVIVKKTQDIVFTEITLNS